MKRRRFTKRAFKLRLKRATVFSIAQVFFFALSFLILISFSRQGLILVKFNDFLTSSFSWATIFLPFIFLSFAFMLSKIKIPLSQPNVVVGSLLFFVSVAAIGQAGKVGAVAWEGVSSLVTPVGAFIVLLGTSVVGLIILFNTSFDAVFKLLAAIFTQARAYIFGESRFDKVINRGQLKVSGGPPTSTLAKNAPGEPLAPKLVSNVPGEQIVWKYPPLELLSDIEGGKADRGDIKGNAAIIEKTLESFGA